MAETNGWDYVATQPIHVDGVRAFNPGDPVHADYVKDHELATSGADAVVTKIGSKAHETLHAELVASQNPGLRQAAGEEVSAGQVESAAASGGKG